MNKHFHIIHHNPLTTFVFASDINHIGAEPLGFCSPSPDSPRASPRVPPLSRTPTTVRPFEARAASIAESGISSFVLSLALARDVARAKDVAKERPSIASHSRSLGGASQGLERAGVEARAMMTTTTKANGCMDLYSIDRASARTEPNVIRASDDGWALTRSRQPTFRANPIGELRARRLETRA